MMKHQLTRLSLVVFGMLLAAGCAELALRVLPLPDLQVLAVGRPPPVSAWKAPAWGDPQGRALQRHEIIGYEHRPAVDFAIPLAEHAGSSFRFRTNNLGLRRDRPTSVARSAGTLRVLILGDSHTDGYVDNDETFSTMLEASLKAS